MRTIPIAGAQPGGAMATSAIRGANSHSHIGILSAADAGIAMHNRLHLGSALLRRLPSCTHDVPSVLSRCPRISCDACMEANASRLSRSHASGHTGRRKRNTTRPGQLVHADIAGPFAQSAAGGYRYALVFVDDFSRYKWVYFMRNKSEAPDYTRTFIGTFNSLLAKRFGADGSFTVSAIHTDNAGEFFSREYADLLDAENVAQSTCPPHVHELNGVAERAIRSIFTMVRSDMVARATSSPGCGPIWCVIRSTYSTRARAPQRTTLTTIRTLSSPRLSNFSQVTKARLWGYPPVRVPSLRREAERELL